MIGSSSDINSALSEISALLEQGRVAQAADGCAAILAVSPDNTSALHLLGLARARLGQPGEAEHLLRQSVQREPLNPVLHINFGNFLRRAGRLPEAEAEYRAALRVAPTARKARHNLALTLAELKRHAEAENESRRLLGENDRDAEAWSLLAFVLTQQDRLFEAEVAYRRALDLAPNYGLAHQNLGSLLIQMDRAEEAWSALEQARELGTPEFELLFSRGRALALLYRFDDAELEFAKAVALRPAHLEAQANLARLRFLRGDPQFAGALLDATRAAPEDLPLQHLLCTLLVRGGRYDDAEARIRDIMRHHGAPPQFRGLLSQMLLESGRLDEAETEALEAAATAPGNSEILDTVVSVLLSRGRAADALPFIHAQRLREPDVQSWLAHEAVAARLLGRPLYRDLYNYEAFVRAWRMEPPAGWSSMRELNAAVMQALKARHRFTSHPLDQSLRNGSQTARNLVVDADPAIQALLNSFREPLQMYLREIGSDPAHPYTARNRGSATITESWSVHLRRGGFHVNHVHPKGWISSAYYVSIPEEVGDAALKSGWLKFGEPRYAVPGVDPAYHVQPEPGLLVLFPSYMWHGTNAIHGPAPRTTIAFDALPDA